MPNSLTIRGAKGDMLKTVYDTEDQGIVDDSQKLQAATKPEVQAHAPEPHTHEQAHITDLDHDAQKIKAVTVDDTAKADQKVLAYDQASEKIIYIPRCPEIVIKAIQHITITLLSADRTQDVLINAVDMDNTFLVYGGCHTLDLYPNKAQARLSLTDSTHILVSRGQTGNPLTLSVFVIECTAGIKSIQRGIITFNSNLTEDATINAVDTDKTFLSYLSFRAVTNEWNKSLIRLSLVDSTTVRAHVATALGFCTVSYEVVEFI